MLSEVLEAGLGGSAVVGVSLALGEEACLRARLPTIPHITLIIQLRAGAGTPLRNRLHIFPVIALGIALSPHVGHLLAEEAVIAAVAAVVGGPEFEVGIICAGVVLSFALGFVEGGEVEVD